MSSPLAAVVLAAGRSTRIEGPNKLLLPWGDKVVVVVVVESLLFTTFKELLVIVGHESERVQEALTGFPVRFVENPQYSTGIASSVVRAVQDSPADAPGYLFALGDMPAVDPGTVRVLCDTFREHGSQHIVVPTQKGRWGNPVIVGSGYRTELLALEGDRGAKPIMERHPEKVIEVPVEDLGIFTDVDTMETYRTIKPDD